MCVDALFREWERLKLPLFQVMFGCSECPKPSVVAGPLNAAFRGVFRERDFPVSGVHKKPVAFHTTAVTDLFLPTLGRP